VQRLATFPLRAMAAPELVERTRGHRPPDLPWVAFSENCPATPESTWLREHVPGARVVLRAPDLQLLVSAARSGVGALVVAEPLGRLAGLAPLPVQQDMPEGTLWLVAHRALRQVPRVDAVWSWLTTVFRSDHPGS
jgi:DNA-binding transcriptional LysR family regulator